MDLYEFEFMFVPYVVYSCNCASTPRLTNLLFDDPLWVLRDGYGPDFFRGDINEFPWDELTFTRQDSEDCRALLITYPEPTCEPMAWYAMIVQRGNEAPRYFTLEMMGHIFSKKPIESCLCSKDMKTHIHSLYCSFDHKLTAEEFRAQVLRRVS